MTCAKGVRLSILLALMFTGVAAGAASNVAVIVVNSMTGSIDAGTDTTFEASRKYGMSQCRFYPNSKTEKNACRILGECHAPGWGAVARSGVEGNYSFSYSCGISKYDAAKSRALMQCAGDCKIVTTFSLGSH